MNLTLEFRNFRNIILVFILIVVLGKCSSFESEKAYCEKKASEYFLLCLVNVSASPAYFGKPEWSQSEIQSYSQAYCFAEYSRKLRCVNKTTYKPHRKD